MVCVKLALVCTHLNLTCLTEKLATAIVPTLVMAPALVYGLPTGRRWYQSRRALRCSGVAVEARCDLHRVDLLSRSVAVHHPARDQTGRDSASASAAPPTPTPGSTVSLRSQLRGVARSRSRSAPALLGGRGERHGGGGPAAVGVTRNAEPVGVLDRAGRFLRCLELHSDAADHVLRGAPRLQVLDREGP